MASINVASLSKKKAAEPSMYVDIKKICRRCKQSNVKFKFLNNKKQNQPRYQCQDCTLELGKPHLFNPFPIREHSHEDGYAKLPKVETEELKNLNKVCDSCQAQNNIIFRGYNNGKLTQPRYCCKGCKKQFSPLKNSKASNRKIDVPSYEFQTTGAQCQEMGASQQPSSIDGSSYEFQTTGAQCQETGALQQPSSIDGSSYEFQTIGAQCQETGASQQPSKIDISPNEFQTTGVQYQETGALQQPLPYNTSYKQTSISYIQNNYYNPCSQSSDNHLVSTMDVDESSNQFAFPSQNAEASQWQQPHLYNTSYDPSQNVEASQWQQPPLYNTSNDPSQNAETSQWQQPPPYSTLYDTSQPQNAETSQWQQPPLYNILYDQTSTSSQQHGYDYYNQSSDNCSLASVDVNGSSNQCPFSWQYAEAWQWQQPPLYNTSFDQTSILSPQQNYSYAYSQSSDNHSLASVDVDGSSNRFPNPSLVAEALRQASLDDPLDQQTLVPSEQHSYRHLQVQSNNNYSLANF